MEEKTKRYDIQAMEPLILTIRGQKVVLDIELARIYGVTTKVFNQAVKRNKRKFPADFMFQLTVEEYEDLRSQLVTLRGDTNRSQFVTGSQKHRNPRYLPYVFTEHGAVMAANILRSKRAVQMSVFVVRAFVRMREMLIEQRSLARKLAELEKELTARLDVHETAINEMFRQIKRLLSPPVEPEPPKNRIGFLVEEPRVPYKSSKGSKNRKGNESFSGPHQEWYSWDQ
jgi:phage regulator Rha-like protein